MTIGYIARCISAESPDVLGPYIVQYICILLPPSLYAASIYMIYGRIVVLVDKAELSLIAPHKVTKVFVLGDALAFMTQLGGGSLMTSTISPDAPKVGARVAMDWSEGIEAYVRMGESG